MPTILRALATLLLVAPLAAQDVQSTLYTRTEGDTIRAAIEVAVEEGWHIYDPEIGHPDAAALPTSVELSGTGITWGPVVFPEPHQDYQGITNSAGEDVWAWIHEGTIVLYAEGELAAGADGSDAAATLDGLVCMESCLPWDNEVSTSGPGPDDLFAAFPAAGEGEPEKTTSIVAPPANTEDAATEEQDPLWGFLLLCIGGGLFALLMPCTYPMIPITVSFFTKQADARKGNVLSLALTYGAGIVLIFILIGVTIGPPIIQFAVHQVTNIVIGALFLYFAFVLFGVINMQPPRFLMAAAGKAQTTGGLLGVFLMGATLVVTSFTCTAPIMGAILAYGGTEGDLLRLVLGMGVFGLTMAVPFVVLSLIPGRIQAMPKSGEWMNSLKFFLGFVEVAASFKFFSNADVKIFEGPKLLPREPFLLLWGIIFLLAGLFLFGFIFRHGGSKPGPRRLVAGVLVVIFAGYSFYGATGRPLDKIMTAIAPPFGEEERESFTTWTLIEDDYDQALEVARRDEKLLFVNFTGHT